MADTEKTIEEVQKEAEEYLNGWKRAKADFMNYQKAVERERADWAMFANVACVKAILPVLDSLEMAVAQQLEEKFHGEGEYDDGIERIRNQMVDVLKQMGVEAIKSVGEPVNPEFHEVVAVDKGEEPASGTDADASASLGSVAPADSAGRHASGLVTKEAQRGYTMHGKVLRVAKVIVAE